MSSELPPGLDFEPCFVIEGVYGPDAAELRRPVRAEHLTRAAKLRDEGVIVEIGAFADMSGSLMIVRAPSEEAALAIAREDPYVRSGVWVEVRARPFARLVRTGESAATG